MNSRWTVKDAAAQKNHQKHLNEIKKKAQSLNAEQEVKAKNIIKKKESLDEEYKA